MKLRRDRRGRREVPRERDAAEEPPKCRDREVPDSIFPPPPAGAAAEQQGEEPRPPNSPTRGGEGGACVPVAAEGAGWT